MRSLSFRVSHDLNNFPGLKRDRSLRSSRTYFRPFSIHQNTDTIGYRTDIINDSGQTFQRDIPLSAEGLSQLRRADIDPKVVYITPLQRTAQTARVLFPEAELVVVKDLQEMCFGSFEGKNYVEMEHDADYQAWVQANCESKCPDGERKDDFSNRICGAFSALVDKALADGEELLVILAHGGTQMAAMERYALPRRGYYAWGGPNAGGYVLDAADWAEKRQLRLVKTVQYTKDAEAGV